MILGHNFGSCLEYDYDTVYSCEYYGCSEEGICRCSEIHDPRVIDVDITKVSNEIFDFYFDNSLSSKRNSRINSIIGGITKDIEKYTIDRILRINKVYETSNWEIQICSGYYGQEVDGVILQEKIADKIQTQIDQALLIVDLKRRVEFLLKLEYGKILPELQNCDWELVKVKRDSVIFGSNSQKNKVAGEELSHYSDSRYKSLRGIVIEKSDGYRLIDGYHRCFASENRFIKVLKAKQK